jgi:uncharacterized protein YuzE
MSLIKVATRKHRKHIPTKAFYDTIGDTVSVGIKQKGQFKSSLDATDFSFELSGDGRVLDIEIWKARKEWQLEPALHPPESVEAGNIIIRDSNQGIDDCVFLTNAARDLLFIRFSEERISRSVSPGNTVIFELNQADELVGLWIVGIEDDINFAKEQVWRSQVEAR